MTGKEIIVYKIGGSVLSDKAGLKNIVNCLNISAGNTLFIHGGGNLIDAWMERLSLKAIFLKGQRVTDDITMELVEMVLSGTVNKKLTNIIREAGYKTAGLSGRDNNTAVADFIDYKYGRVGDIKKMDLSLIEGLMDKEFIPVISPVSAGADGGPMNVNADFFAAKTAVNLSAAELNIITSTGGVLKEGSILKNLNCEKAIDLIREEVASEGMIPKLKAAVTAVEGGVKKVNLLDYSGVRGTCIK